MTRVEETVFCSICSGEMSCPPSMKKKERHVCARCFLDDNTSKKDLENAHVEIDNEDMEKAIVGTLLEETFPDVWAESKGELKNMSRKEAAQYMFSLGIVVMLNMGQQISEEDAARELRKGVKK